ncbi:MAG: tetratricopeptide repeat protein [Bacteroidia bacterium]|nr:tetratricopeptide repeat protein [Bacteroidia bacterium]
MRIIFFGIICFVFCFNLAQAQNKKWQAWEVEADTLLNKQDFEGALKIYTKIIKSSKLKDESVFGAVYKRAICYYSLGQFENALKDINVFIPAYPSSSQAHLLRAFLYRELDDDENQLIDLQEAINIRQGDPELLRWRAALYLDKGEYLLAKQDIFFVKQYQTDPEIETYLGMAYYNLSQQDSALMAMNRAIELDVNYLPAYFYAASFCLQEDEYDLALKYINIPLRLDPQNPTALFYKGVALVEKKNLDAGCSCLNKAFYLGNDDAGDYLKEYCYEVED